MPFKSLSSLVEDAATLQGYSTKCDFSDNLFEYIPVTNSDGLLYSGLAKLSFNKLLSANESYSYDVGGSRLYIDSTGMLNSTSETIHTSGYVKTITGLILCWGSGTRTTEGIETVTFPITFPNACLNVFVVGRLSSSSSASDWYAQIISWNTSSFTWQMQMDGSSGNADGCYYLAVGW